VDHVLVETEASSSLPASLSLRLEEGAASLMTAVNL
jgi:hypothetical protein